MQSGALAIDEAFKREERILTLLRSLRHPSIIPLLASYTTQKAQQESVALLHHMLFPVADCDLSAILRNKSYDALQSHFQTDCALSRALYSLASAIENVHNYVSGEFNLTMIGCHYDLSPRNILVERNRLFLADFGLSRLQREGSRSIFKKGAGDYLAPECEPLVEDNFSKGLIGRESDIWSFGCVLLEIFVYQLWQGKGVEAFRSKRKKKILGCFTAYQFHAFGGPHSAVEEELRRIAEECPGIEKDIVGLIKGMLSIEPSLRPKAAAVTARLYMFAQKLLYNSCLANFNVLEELSCDLQFVIERQRFAIWGWGAELAKDSTILSFADDDDKCSWLMESKERWPTVTQTLELLHEEASLLETTLGNGPFLRPMYTRIRDLNDLLWSLPPQSVSQRMFQVLRDRMTSSDDTEVLRDTTNALSSHLPYEDIALLAAIKYTTSRVNGEIERGDRRLLLNDHVQLEGTVGLANLNLGSVLGRVESRPVVIEWMQYGPHWINQNSREELFDRVEAVAELFSKVQMPRRITVLQCSGYYHNPMRNAFGLLYDFPANTATDSKPSTLNDVLRRCPRPLLGELYDLARGITECILNIHRVGWLHKSISAYSILFFDAETQQVDVDAEIGVKIKSRSQAEVKSEPVNPSQKLLSASDQKSKKGRSPGFLGGFRNRAAKSKEIPGETLPSTPIQNTSVVQPLHTVNSLDGDSTGTVRPLSLKMPYMVGFNHSRPDQDSAFTQGPSTDRRQMVYQHPEYTLQSKRLRFRSAYDYYSLGLLLLEIGLWKPLSDLADKSIHDYTPKEQQDLWLVEFVPRLGSSMGMIYRDAVRACLNGELDDESGSMMVGNKPLQLFEVKVVNQLESCCA